MAKRYPRDMVGYGAEPPQAKWPKGARLAVQFVLNYEEGAENSVLHGDVTSESFLSDIVGAKPLRGVRNMNMESLYEYGSRVGVWRVLRMFEERRLPMTVYAVAMALERNRKVAKAIVDAGHEIASHGWRWIDYQFVDIETEREHMRLAIESIERVTGSRPLGWYTGRMSPNTRKLVVEEGGFLYDADGKAHLVVPYTLDANDMRFATVQGFNSGEQFFAYLKDAFDVLYAEGAETPKMMSVGLHCRLIGRPGRAASLARFLDYVQGHEEVWVCRRVDIARHWRKHHPYKKAAGKAKAQRKK